MCWCLHRTFSLLALTAIKTEVGFLSHSFCNTTHWKTASFPKTVHTISLFSHLIPAHNSPRKHLQKNATYSFKKEQLSKIIHWTQSGEKNETENSGFGTIDPQKQQRKSRDEEKDEDLRGNKCVYIIRVWFVEKHMVVWGDSLHLVFLHPLFPTEVLYCDWDYH